MCDFNSIEIVSNSIRKKRTLAGPAQVLFFSLL